MLYHLIAFSSAVATGTADADCLGYHYKINGVCTGVQQFPTATACGLASGGKDSHPKAVDKTLCMEFATARVPADQQVPMVSWGNLGKPLAASFAGEINDPLMPSGCVAHSNSNTYQWNNAVGGAVFKWWKLVCMEDITPPPSEPPLNCVGYHYDINGVCTGVQQFPGASGCGLANGGKDSHMLALDRAFCEEFGTAKVPADQQIPMRSWGNLGRSSAATFAGEVNDPNMPSGCVTHANQNLYKWNTATSGAVNGWWRPVCMVDMSAPAPSAAALTAPPTTLPTASPTAQTMCDCRQTTALYVEGARCMGPRGESIGYRKTINWCCSDYGCNKGYKWVDTANDKCMDDNFIGTCMFSFIHNGGCSQRQLSTSDLDTLSSSVDPTCFDCDNIGDLVEQECSGSDAGLQILSDMIQDARRLEQTPLPANDADLKKMNKRIAKIRKLLKEKKQASKAVIG